MIIMNVNKLYRGEVQAILYKNTSETLRLFLTFVSLVLIDFIHLDIITKL